MMIPAHRSALIGHRAMLAIQWSNIVTLLGMLLAVVVVLFLAWFATRLIAGRGLPGFSGGDEHLRVLRQLTLGQNERLVLVQIDGKCLLLGVTAGGITLLREFSEEEAAEWLPKDGPEGSVPPSFLDVLKQNLPHRK